MTTVEVKPRFEAKLLRPAKPGNDTSWAFVALPRAASEPLPRRGRTTVDGTLNGHPFQATLEPDGQLSHWLHWITSAKQLKTRAKRIGDACDMLASGKKHVCCFDPSGYYSKAFRALEAADA